METPDFGDRQRGDKELGLVLRQPRNDFGIRTGLELFGEDVGVDEKVFAEVQGLGESFPASFRIFIDSSAWGAGAARSRHPEE